MAVQTLKLLQQRLEQLAMQEQAQAALQFQGHFQQQLAQAALTPALEHAVQGLIHARHSYILRLIQQMHAPGWIHAQVLLSMQIQAHQHVQSAAGAGLQAARARHLENTAQGHRLNAAAMIPVRISSQQTLGW